MINFALNGKDRIVLLIVDNMYVENPIDSIDLKSDSNLTK